MKRHVSNSDWVTVCSLRFGEKGVLVFDLEFPNLPLSVDRAWKFQTQSGIGALQILKRSLNEEFVSAWRVVLPPSPAAFDYLDISGDDHGKIVVVADRNQFEQTWTAAGHGNVTVLRLPSDLASRSVSALRRGGFALREVPPFMGRVSIDEIAFDGVLTQTELEKVDGLLGEVISPAEWQEMERTPQELISVLCYDSKEAILEGLADKPYSMLPGRRDGPVAVRLCAEYSHYHLEIASSEAGCFLGCYPAAKSQLYSELLRAR